MTTKIQNVAAYRSLDRTHSNGTITTVDVSMGDNFFVPASSSNAADMWGVCVEINGADDSDLQTKIYGEDSMQAVQVAMKFVGRILDDSKCAREIEAYGSRGETQFGFPKFRKKIRHNTKLLQKRP